MSRRATQLNSPNNRSLSISSSVTLSATITLLVCETLALSTQGTFSPSSFEVYRIGCELLIATGAIITLKKRGDSAGVTDIGFPGEAPEVEPRYGMAMAAAHIGCWDWDIRTDTQTWSDTYKTLLGLPPESSADFQAFLQRVHTEDRDTVRAAIDSALKTTGQYSCDYRVIWPDRSVHWQSGRGRVFHDDLRHTTRMLGITMDIGDRKLAEFRPGLQTAALEAAANSIVITDHTGIIQWTNRAFTQLTGYAAEEVCGKTPSLLKSGKHDKSLYESLWRTINQGRIWHGEMVNRRKDGSLYTEEQTITPVRLNSRGITHFIAIKQDVTDRKHAEEVLRQTEENYRSLFENAPVGIYQSTPDGRFLSVNPALAHMCGYETPEQQIAATGNLARDWYVDPERREELKRLMAKDDAVRDFEYEARRKDGTIILLLQNARSVKNADGRVLYYNGAVEDITGRRQLEAQLRQAQKMEAIGRLAGGVAHDFNNALSVISGYGELLQLALPSGERLHRHVEEILKATRRAGSLTHQLLGFSRKQTIQPKMLDLNAVVRDVEKMLRRLIGEDVDFRTNADSSLKRVKADRGQIEQVLINLAANARDAMPRGGTLLIETANVDLDEIHIQQHPYAKPGAYVMLAVSDTGCGMDKETQAHVFEPFFTTKEIGKGTGLGLSNVYGIVKQNQGFISVYSELGTGATFRIYLPSAEGAAESAPPPETPRNPPNGTETILLVEDEDSLRELARVCLQSAGYTILEARSGQEAIEIGRQYGGNIQLLLTDVVMPGISGSALAATLVKTQPAMRVLFMSGYAYDIITRHGVLSPEVTLLEKPLTISSLLTKVREVLDADRANVGRTN